MCDRNLNWSEQEYSAYSAMESARAGQDVGIILNNLGYYHQGVVDAACGSRKHSATRKKIKKSKKSC